MLSLVVWVFKLDYLDLNSIQKQVNGNKTKNLFVDVLSQNIPGHLRGPDIQLSIDIIIDRYNPTVLVLTEVDSAKVSLCHFPNYSLVTGKLKNAKKVRICLLVKNGYDFEELDLNCHTPTVSIKIKSMLTVIGVYREWTPMTTDKVTPEACWKSFITTVSKKHLKNAVIIGDTNIDLNLKNQSKGHYKSVEKLRNQLLEFAENAGFDQIISKCTRFQKNKDPSLLDHVWTDCPGNVDRTFTRFVVESDHKLVGIRFLWLHVTKKKQIKYRNWKKLDPECFSRLFHCSNVFEVYQCNDVNKAVWILTMKINAILDVLVPVQTITIGGRQTPWLTDDLRNELDERNRLHEAALQSKTDEDWSCFRQRKNEVRKLLKAKKAEHNKMELNDPDSKTRWSKLKSISGIDPKSEDKELVIKTEAERPCHPRGPFQQVFC